MVTAIILSHYKERENNLPRIIDNLLASEMKPETIVVFIDNPEINFKDDRVMVIRSSKSLLPRIRFSLGTYFLTDHCFFIDDDLTVSRYTIGNLYRGSKLYPESVIGYEGSILGNTDNPYADDVSVNRGLEFKNVDVVIRTYFVPTKLLLYGIEILQKHKHLPTVSLDDVYLCLGNKYLNYSKNMVIPVQHNSGVIELDEAGVGQSRTGIHYENRNKVCRYLMDYYA